MDFTKNYWNKLQGLRENKSKESKFDNYNMRSQLFGLLVIWEEMCLFIRKMCLAVCSWKKSY